MNVARAVEGGGLVTEHQGETQVAGGRFRKRFESRLLGKQGGFVLLLQLSRVIAEAAEERRIPSGRCLGRLRRVGVTSREPQHDEEPTHVTLTAHLSRLRETEAHAYARALPQRRV
jgi:hypothetical protein